MACPVGKKVEITPSAGAYTLPSSGSIAIPLPIDSDENASSFTSARATTFPLIGAAIETLVFLAASVFKLLSELFFTSFLELFLSPSL